MRTELVKLRTTVKAGGNIENIGRIRELKRTVARILTIQNEKTSPEVTKA
jgi:ribosomal protein L29